MNTFRTNPTLLAVGLLTAAGHVIAQDPRTGRCEVVTRKGHKITIDRFVSITNGVAVYASQGSLHDLWVSDIRKLTCGGRPYEIGNDSLRPSASAFAPPATTPRAVPVAHQKDPTPADLENGGHPIVMTLDTDASLPLGSMGPPALSDSVTSSTEGTRTDPAPATRMIVPSSGRMEFTRAKIPARFHVKDSTMCRLGMEDAVRFYNPIGAGALSFYLAPTLIGPIIVGAIPPKPTSRNPNQALYYTDPDYRQGYDRKAKNRKGSAVGAGFGIFMLILAAALASGG